MKENQTNERITAVLHDRPSVSLAEILCFADVGCHFSFFSGQVRHPSTSLFKHRAHSTKKAPRALSSTGAFGLSCHSEGTPSMGGIFTVDKQTGFE